MLRRLHTVLRAPPVTRRPPDAASLQWHIRSERPAGQKRCAAESAARALSPRRERPQNNADQKRNQQRTSGMFFGVRAH